MTRFTTGAMVKMVRKRAMPTRIWFGGVCWVPMP